ncbi:sigma-70 family RNA polymerase sigma factor [Eubacterium sp. 1001713B170207_170306_E7]|uniref:RNA polymerase sigma factor n=1 Tax=Eubacterium sp. 1001713B170207_170306_E7 TaxID=2787097 RepID=UPI00189919BD|nr:sigma-70 family RNA polymerase sigma factor [Eubacterium sp. 1001713B170207_170306_E7]
MQERQKREDYTALDALVRRAQQGDRSAMEGLLLAFKPMLWSVISRYVYDNSEYEDAYQEACAAFIQGVRDFALEARVYFQTFMQRRLSHYFLKRREGRFNASLTGAVSLDTPVEGADGAVALIELILDERADVEGACVASEQRAACLRAFRRLSPGQKQVLRWQYLEKGTLSELAARKGVSPAAVTQTHKRALAAMKRHL